MTKTIAVFLMFSNFCSAQDTGKKFEFKPGDAEVIEIRTGEANLNLSTDEKAIKAETIGEYDEKLCDFSAVLEGKTLKVSLKGKKSESRWNIFSFLFGVSAEEESVGVKTEKKWFSFEKGASRCKAGLRLTAPKGKKVAVKSGAGNMKIDGFSAGAGIDTGAGNLELKNFSGPLKIASGAGSVQGDLYSEDLDIGTGAGSVDLKWNAVPKKGKASVGSGAGNLSLSFPEKTAMAITHKSGAGGFDSAFGDDPKAPFSVELKTGAGNQEIKKY